MPKILKVKFDNISLKDATKKAIEWSKGKIQKHIVTPNPEILLEAQKNHKFLEVLHKADLSIPDGTGILWSAKYLKITEKNKSKIIKIIKWLSSILSIALYPKYIHTEIFERVTGADLMEDICKNSAKNNLKIFLLGGANGIAEKAKEKLERKFKNIKITGIYGGSPKESDQKIITEKINNSHANILLVAFGAPAQEMWIARNLKNLKTIKVALGVGGTFDYIAEAKKRAPKLIQKIGIEWLYRLVQQPSRTKRIFNATIKFPITILHKSLKS